MADKLPAPVREKIEKLRLGKHAHLVELLVKKRDAAQTDEERQRVDKLILELGRPSRTSWFGWTLVAFMVSVVSFHAYTEYRHDQAVKAGVPAVAQVKRLEEANCVLGSKRSRCMELSLEVHPANGDAYAATLEHDVALEWMSRVQPGSFITVAVDPSDKSRVHLDEAALSVEPPKPPKRPPAP